MKGKTKPKQEHHKPEQKAVHKAEPKHEEQKQKLAEPRPPPVESPQERCTTPQVTTYDTINEAIHEYLLKSGLFKTVDSFQQELLYGKATIDRYIQTTTLGQNFGQTYLLEAFDKGRKDAFFECWRRLLPMHLQANDEICHKLEFYIRVYFAIYPMHPSNPHAGDAEKLKTELEGFKVYLDAERTTLAQIPELLPFYALPFVDFPNTHPSFKHLFNTQWANELRNKLSIFAGHFLPPLGPPLIYEIYRVYRELQKTGAISEALLRELAGKGDEGEAMRLREELKELQIKEERARVTLIESQTKWTNFSKGILTLCKSLLSLTTNPQPVMTQKTMLKEAGDKLAKYEQILSVSETGLNDIVSGSEHAHEKEGGMARLKELEALRPYEQEDPNELSIYSSIAVSSLNFAKIKEFLQTSKDKLKICAVLQALRWRIANAPHGPRRRQEFEAFVSSDILCCGIPGSHLLSNLMMNADRKYSGSSIVHRIVEYALCFINVLASFSVGAMYLAKSDDLIRLLISHIHSEKGDTNLRQNALGALQKLSLHRRPQTIMIESGLIKWILTVLRVEAATLTDYTHEYVIALLMNLSLRTAGKQACEDPELDVLNVLVRLFVHHSLQVRTYVNGTLYSLLTRPKILQQGRTMGLAEKVKGLIASSDEQIGRQLKYILDQLEADKVEECYSDSGETVLDDDEDYETENEIEVDMEIVNAGVQVGDQLLQEFAEGPAVFPISPNKAGHTAKSSVSGSIRNLPTAMRSRPKIPRTPISKELLDMGKRSDIAPSSEYNSGLISVSGMAEVAKQEKQEPSVKIEVKEEAETKAEEKEQETEKAEQKPAAVGKEEGKGKPGQDPMTQTQEFEFAFKDRSKLPRSPATKERKPAPTASTRPGPAAGSALAPKPAAGKKKRQSGPQLNRQQHCLSIHASEEQDNSGETQLRCQGHPPPRGSRIMNTRCTIQQSSTHKSNQNTRLI